MGSEMCIRDSNGVESATNVSLTDTLPAGLTIAPGHGAVTGTGTSTGGSYDTGSGLWTVGSLAVGDTATLTLVGTVDTTDPTTLTNTTTAAAGDQVDLITDTDDLDEAVDVTITPAMTLTKVADDTTDVEPGQTVTYTYTVENTGDVNIDDVTVSDVHSGTGTLSAIAVGTLTNTSGNSSDDGADGDVDVLAAGDLSLIHI